jgi:hypothetical protein
MEKGAKNRYEGGLWGETIGTVRNVSNVSLEDVLSRTLYLNGREEIDSAT